MSTETLEKTPVEHIVEETFEKPGETISWENISHDFSTSKRKLQHLVIEKQIRPFLKFHPKLEDNDVASFANIIIHSIQWFNEKDIQSCITQLVVDVSKQEATPFLLLSTLIKSNTQLFSNTSRVAILQFVIELSKSNLNKELLTQVVIFMSPILQTIISRDFGFNLVKFKTHKIAKRLTRLFSVHPALVEIIFCTEISPVAFGGYFSLFAPKQQGMTSQTVFDVILSLTKNGSFPSTFWCVFANFFAILDEKQILIISEICKNSLKSSHSLVPFVKELLTRTSHFEILEKGVIVLLNDLKSEDALVRQDVLDVIHTLSSKCSDEKIHAKWGQEIISTSTGLSANEKAACVRALGFLKYDKSVSFLEPILKSKTTPDVVRFEAMESLCKHAIPNWIGEAFQVADKALGKLIKICSDHCKDKTLISSMNSKWILVAKGSEKKVTERGTAICALSALVKVSALTTGEIVGIFANPFLISPMDVLSKYHDFELEGLAELIHFAFVSNLVPNEDNEAFFNATLALLNSKSLSVRKLMKKLFVKEMEPKILNVLSDFCENSPFPITTLPLPSTPVTDVNTMGKILYWTHFASLNNSTWKPWFKQHTVAISDFISHHVAELFEYLTEGNDTERKQTTAGLALSSMIKSGDATASAVYHLIGNQFEKTIGDLTRWNHRDYEIYHTPEGTLYRDVSKEVYNPFNDSEAVLTEDEIFESKYALTSQEWQEIPSSKQEAALKKMFLTKESKIRQEMNQSKEGTLFWFHVVRICNKTSQSKYVSGLIPMIANLLNHPLVQQDAETTFETCCEPFVTVWRHMSKSICIGTASIYREDNVALMEHLVTKIRLASRNVLDGHSFSLIYPFLSQVVTKSQLSSSTITMALNIIGSHVGQHLPHRVFVEVLKSLLYVIKYYPQLYKQASHALISCGGHLQPQDLTPILNGLIHPNSNIRLTCLNTLAEYSPFSHSLLVKHSQENAQLAPYLFLSVCGETDHVKLATSLWSKLKTIPDKTYLQVYYDLIGHHEQMVVKMASGAIQSLVAKNPEMISDILKHLYGMYESNVVPAKKKFPRQNGIRYGIAYTLNCIASSIKYSDLEGFFNFLVFNGLYDELDNIRETMQSAGLNVILYSGPELASYLYTIFEDFLSKGSKESEADDYVFSSLVIFLGSVAKNLDQNIDKIVARLLESCLVPSNSVQHSVSNVLAPLIKRITNPGKIIERLLNELSTEAQRGNAFALAGCVAGLGIGSIQQFKIIESLEQYANNKASKIERESAMICYEVFMIRLGILFEPYFRIMIPDLLACFADNEKDVRNASLDCAKRMMSQISEHGVRMILPGILSGIQDSQWRTKKGSVQLLGSMAYLAPKQLSRNLPIVVEKLSAALSDTHPEVANESKLALQRVGGVVGNPEISSQVPQLLAAIDNPDQTESALDNLLNTRFVHSIDPASLSLLIPVLIRGLKTNNVDVKMKSALIVSNMTQLVDKEEVLVPYIPILMPILQGMLSDAHPQVRAASAKAIGILSTSVAKTVDTILPWLFKNVKKDGSIAERCGNAQAIAELFNAQRTTELLESRLPDMLTDMSESNSPAIRHGIIQIFVYLPALMKSKFTPYLPSTLPKILGRLSDNEESVREAAIQSLKILVNLFALQSMDLILPALMEGITADPWRTRQCCLVILTDFLDRIADSIEVTKKDVSEATLIDPDALMKVLGDEQVHQIIAQIFLLQYDLNTNVVSEAISLWKSLVSNTTRTCRMIMKSLTKLLIDHLAMDSDDHRQMAAKALGEFVKRMGHRILGEIIPLLEEGLESDHVETRQGSCLGLTELMNSSPKHAPSYSKQLVPAVKRALCDPEEAVQETASGSFDALIRVMGSGVVEVISESILNDMLSGNLDALNGLGQVVLVRPNYVLPKLMPILCKNPLTEMQSKALSKVIPNCGNHLTHYLVSIMATLIKEYQAEKTPVYVREAISAFVTSIPEDLLPYFLDLAKKNLAENDVATRSATSFTLSLFFAETDLDLSEDLESILDTVVRMYADPSTDVLSDTIKMMNALVASIDKEEWLPYIPKIRSIIKEMSEDSRTGQKNVDTLTGFNAPDGLTAFLTILLHGLVSGKTSDTKELSSATLSDIIELTEADVLKKYVVKMTGPLIRIIGERNPWQVKSAILVALNLLLTKSGATMKPFLPQLQTTFLKSLADPNKSIPTLSAQGLGKLVTHGAKPENIMTELINLLKNFKATTQMTSEMYTNLNGVLSAIQSVVGVAGVKIRKQITEVVDLLIPLTKSRDDIVKKYVAIKLGGIAQYVEDFDAFVESIYELDEFTALYSFYAMIKIWNPKISDLDYYLKKQCKHEVGVIKRIALKTMCCYMELNKYPAEMIKLIQSIMEDDKQAENRFEACKCVKNMAKKQPGNASLMPFIGSMIKLTKDKNTTVKGMSFRALTYLLDLHTGKYVADLYREKNPEHDERLQELVSKLEDVLEVSEDEVDEIEK